MNNIFVYCEIEEGLIADVSYELLSKGRKLADELQCKLNAVVIGDDLNGIENNLFKYGVDTAFVFDDNRFYPYRTLPHASIVTKLFEEEKPQIALFGATSIGRDLAPRVASALKSGLTADCTNLVIGDYTETRTGKEYKNLLYQIRPAFGGSIIATIVNPDTKPQLATVREGVMKNEPLTKPINGEVVKHNIDDYIKNEDFVLDIIERHIEAKKINIKGASIIIAGGYGVGSKASFDKLFELAEILGAEVGASRAAVDAGFVDHERQIGQTGITVRPKLYIACGISGAVQHRAGMDESAMIISINSDPKAPINSIADYVIIGDINDVMPKMIKKYKELSK
ncbi:MAG: electron transfer flavoprotein subunit alpha [Bacteroidetes bacterium GWE2_29_8]|nr:MAG: electron transfer flavoprotein subunit alpha [Bacteroidetes bacterium GWE2_29_8]OFY20793.1 MAG: electron transfer flavoprotein subunit alpha [Bacteroidetes bacterium GWF2_29_10]